MPLSSGIDGFLKQIKQGVKPNMFEVDIQFPSGAGPTGGDLELTNLLCKSTNLPGSNLGVIEVPFRGRTVKIAGDRTFDNWSATFFNDKDFKVRGFFEEWSQFINTHQENTAPRFIPEFGESGYMATIKVHQLEKNDIKPGGSIIRTYELMHSFPTSVSSIDLAYDSNDQIEEFTVEFQMSYWTTSGATAPAAAAAAAQPPTTLT
tara:strand:- start:513 stop:1127 length:615 start_codon:yes stop_codon:yes gene_type:complete